MGGGEEENRTPDLVIANDALSQLSYPPNFQILEPSNCGTSASGLADWGHSCPFEKSDKQVRSRWHGTIPAIAQWVIILLSGSWKSRL
jgi:hypothetical protein